MVQQLPDLDDALETMDDHVHVGAVVVRDGGLLQDITAGVELVEYLFEPKLVGLVDDDEQHLIVGMKFALDHAEGSLQVQKFVDGEITAVIGGLLVAIERTLHPRNCRALARGKSIQ